MSVALRTVLNVKDNKQEIIAISARIYENVTLEDTTAPEKLPCQTFTLVRPIQQVLPPGFQAAVNEHKGNIRIEQSEQGILNVFLGMFWLDILSMVGSLDANTISVAKLQLIDPDVLIGHQLENVDYSVLLHRMKEKKIHAWHRIGRMRRSAWPHNSGRFTGSFYAERGLVAGRLMCDLANDLGKV